MHKYHEARKRARKKWRQSEKGKAWDKAYSHRDYVKAKAHEYYIKRKIREASNENLHVVNTEGFVNYERRREEETQF
tara:strand:+ start:244 stop:474 length:231 start_codon:yes stop_codon:yes gene_type:complete